MSECISIYVHIPFCERKCNYCAFNSFCAEKDEIEKYIDLLCREIQARKTDKRVKTIYIGGGTPSILSETQFEKIVKCLYDNFDIYEDAEFTIEANPNSITEDKLLCWKKLRVNRVSIGVQSLSDKSLKKIGRLHTKKMALEKIKLTRKYFANVSCDLIVGLEGETGKDLCGYAHSLLDLKVKHISCYLLEVYEATALHSMIANKKYMPLDDGQTIESFNKLAKYLVEKGMERYEISNFAFLSFESRHNLNYWARGEYLGFGLSAHSFVNGVRFENVGSLQKYAEVFEKQDPSTLSIHCHVERSCDAKHPTQTDNLDVVPNISDEQAQDDNKTELFEKVERLSQQEENEEKIMLGMRCCLGFKISDLKNYDIEKNPYFSDYLKQGIIKKEGDIVTLNPLFYHLSNTIISNLLP